MDSQLLGIITLLRSALKNEALRLPEGFDWNAAMPILREHHLVAMAVRGAPRCGVPRTEPAICNLTAQFCKDVAKSRLQSKLLHGIYAAFQDRGIAYMPVKGAVLRDLYPQSELRPMGDADILIRQEQYPIIRDIMRSFGMQNDTESDHELIWSTGEFKLELHKRLIPSYNKDYYAYYGDGWQLAQKDEHSSAHFLSPEDHFVYLLVHFAKHYRDGSINAKNICDFWVCRKAYANMDEGYIRRELQKLKLLKFYENILDLLDTWFEGAPPTEATELLTRTIFNGGVYSFEESQRTVSVIKLRKESTSLSGSKCKWLRNLLFPPVKTMKLSYPILKKCPILLPLLWVVRWFKVLFFRHAQLRRGIASSQELMHMDEEQITQYEEQLHSVGLDFNFPQ